MKFKLTFLIIVFASTISLHAQTKHEHIDSLLRSYYSNGKFNGSVLISENGKIIYKNGFGYANFEWNIKNEPDTKFKIGSCTKQFTAVLIVMLIEEGKLSFNDYISKYIPEYPLEKGNKITIHNLLSHTSGIPEYFNLPQMESLSFKDNKPDDFIKNFCNLELEFEPGTQLKYSNSGYFLLGKIIENITGKSYKQVITEKIFKPLAMSNSGVLNEIDIFEKKAYGYTKEGDTLKVAPFLNASGAFSAGYIYSTVEDLFKWQLALQSNTLLKKESLDKMLTLNFSRYGYGFGILNLAMKNEENKTLYGHEGMINGFRSLIHIFREDNSSIILLDNNQNNGLYIISKDIRNILYEEK